jgi:hypothetical protein
MALPRELMREEQRGRIGQGLERTVGVEDAVLADRIGADSVQGRRRGDLFPGPSRCFICLLSAGDAGAYFSPATPALP